MQLNKKYHEFLCSKIAESLPKANSIETIYHYTNLKSFISIIQNKELWLSNIHFLNDKIEIVHAFDLLKKIITKLSNSPRFNTHKALIEALNTWLNRTSSTESFIYNLSNDLFVFSTSIKSDSLSQFRGYCKGGIGLSIGFNLEKLESLLKGNDSLKENGPCFICAPVIYELENKEKLIENLLISLGEYSIKNENSIDEILFTFFIDFISASCFFKDQSFSEESEFRIVVMEEQNLEKDYYLNSNNIIVPFIKIKHLDFSDAIDKIVLGPCEDKTIKKSLEYLLENNKIKKDILEISQIPLR